MRSEAKSAFGGKKILVFGIFLILSTASFLMAQIPGPEFTPNLDAKSGTIETILQVDENTYLLCGRFFDKNTGQQEIWLYLFNKNKTYKTLIKYLNADTDNEIAVLYIEKMPIVIGPIGKGTVKKDFVSYLYSQEDSGDFVIVFKHYKDFDIEKKEGKLIAKYKVNLAKLAKELV